MRIFKCNQSKSILRVFKINNLNYITNQRRTNKEKIEEVYKKRKKYSKMKKQITFN